MQSKLNKKDLSTLKCEHLVGVGKRLAEKLERLGIYFIQDLLFHLPFRYQDRTRIFPLKYLTMGMHAVIEGNIVRVSNPKGGRTRLLVYLQDATGHIHIRFFYINNAQRMQLTLGKRLRCFGETRLGPNGLEMIHPEYYVLDNKTLLPVEENLTPIYPTTEGLSQLMLRKLTNQSLSILAEGGFLNEILPADILSAFNFLSLKDALHFVHRPPANISVEILEKGEHAAQKRLVFEELLAHRLSLLQLKKNFQDQKGMSLITEGVITQQFLGLLPFKLTQAQQRVTKEIYQDLKQSRPMLRLLQGDVGSGKTVVAALSILQAVENNYQAALLAPTELLAEQHFQVLQKWFIPFNITVVLLSGQMKTSIRKEALSNILEHKAQVIVGTHAIFQKEVSFSKLALIIIDEQHRFGVQQRALLREKGMNNGYSPHQLIMTATPIPRTLAMSIYADLDYSIIDELPPGRTPVQTTVINNIRRVEILERIREICLAGRQAYWVCTLIQESDVLQCQAAEKTAEELKIALPELKISLLHGRMKTKEKEEIMTLFKKGEIHLLVATTVVEVGVDVPNASLMVIENAERLGLAQLHQLRGRVGRGSEKSYCLLMYQAPLSQQAKARLEIMRETCDGFRIAERDLELRGPGEVLGTKQTGDISLRIADLVRDSDLLPSIQQAASLLEKNYSQSIEPLIQRWLGDRRRYGQV